MKTRGIWWGVLLLPLMGIRLLAADSDALIQWLLEDGRDLKSVPFSEVVRATSGRKVIPVDAKREADRALLAGLGLALDRALARLNKPDSPAQKQRRINEVSSHFETAIREEINAMPGFSCELPRTAAGSIQRSGYPDLRVVEKAGGRVVYLDPKLYEKGNRESSLRTFYFEPKRETNKILEDAHHLLVGIEHDGREGGIWRFLQWELVDLSHLRVRLKAEFQGSNRDLYKPEAIVGRGDGTGGEPGGR